MGAALVSAAYHPHWAATLTPAERIVLVTMCLSALDKPRPGKPAELYYGGEEALVIALDGDLPDRDTPAYHTRTVAVGKLVASLIRKRAIVREVPGRRGTKAVYRLTLDAHLQPTLLDDPHPVHNSRSNVHPLRLRAVPTTSLSVGPTTSLTP